MKRPWRKRSYKQLSKGEVGEPVAADQRNLIAMVSIADITAKVENDSRESVMKLAQTHNVPAKTVHAALHNDLQISRSQPGG
jgi:hypothetical protein